MNQVREHDALVDRLHHVRHLVVGAQADQPARRVAAEVGAVQIRQEQQPAGLLAALGHPGVELGVALPVVGAELAQEPGQIAGRGRAAFVHEIAAVDAVAPQA